MSRANRPPLLLLALTFLLLAARPGYGCSCGPKPTVLDAYERAEVVVVARVVSLETAPKRAEGKPEVKPAEEPAEESAEEPDEPEEEKADAAGGEERPEEPEEEVGPREGHGGVISTKMVVERVYKGGLKGGDEMVFGQGGGADCIWTFDADDLGRRYLFYVKRLKGVTAWFAGTCGRSRPVEYAHDDLLYLNKLERVRGRTRLSGTVAFDAKAHTDVAGLKVRVVGAGKTFEARTDANGVYEIYDLPAGRYTLEPETPPGWKVDSFWRRYSPSAAAPAEGESPKGPLKKIPFVVEAGKHAGLDIHFEIDNAIAGKVFDTEGRPMDRVCLDLLPAQGEVPKHFYKADCTEGGGRFRMEEIPPGAYVIVVNKEGKITSSEPFGTFYYPNAARREDATVFHVGLGDSIENVQIHVPKGAETVTVEGAFLYSDGKPVVGEWVEFRAEKTGEDDDADAQAKTDAKGRFSIRILKGMKGRLHGRMYTYVGEVEDCPALDAVIKKTGEDNAEFVTPDVALQADANLYEVELRFPFPGCKKTK